MKTRYLLFFLMVILAVCGLSRAATKVLEWKFDNNDLTDTSGNGLNGEPCGTPTFGPGVSGQAMISDGNTGAYIVGVSTSLLPVLANDSWTVNVWVYSSMQPSVDWRTLWSMGMQPIGNWGLSRCIYASTSSSVVFNDGTPYNYTSTNVPFDVNQWQMITTTFDGNYVRIYKNGLLIGKKMYNASTGFLDAPGEVRIPSSSGDYTDFPWGGLAGKYDEFTIWRGALTQQQIITLIPPGVVSEKGPIIETVHYSMDEPNGLTMTLPDDSGHYRDGNLIGYTNPIANWVAPGQKSASLVFDGNQKVDLPAAAIVSRGIQYSVAFWFKSGWQPFNSAFYQEKAPASNDGSLLVIRGDGDSKMQIYSNDQWWSREFIMIYDLVDYLHGDEWHHLALTVDGDAAMAKWYMDGQLFASCATSGDIGLKKNAMSGRIGWNAETGYSPGPPVIYYGQHYLGEWDRTYIDDLHLYKGVLSQKNVQALMASGNIDNDFDVDKQDLGAFADDWLAPSTPGTTLMVDNMEDPCFTLSHWAVSDANTCRISSTTNAYRGSKAMEWDYNLPASVGGSYNYTSVYFDANTTLDLTSYDVLKLYLYRHSGNVAEDPCGVLFLRFCDAGFNSKAEARIYGPNSVVVPVNKYKEWFVDLDRQLYTPDGNYTTKASLTGIRYLMIGCGSKNTNPRTGSIDIDEVKLIRLPVCSPYLPSDLNYDCKVDFRDFAIFAEDWMFGVN